MIKARLISYCDKTSMQNLILGSFNLLLDTIEIYILNIEICENIRNNIGRLVLAPIQLEILPNYCIVSVSPTSKTGSRSRRKQSATHSLNGMLH